MIHFDPLIHRLRHGFQDNFNPNYICGEDIEASCHYFRCLCAYSSEKLILMNIINGACKNILAKNDLQTTAELLYGYSSLYKTSNKHILKAVIDFLSDTKRFDFSISG